MYIKLDEMGYITTVAHGSIIPDGIEVEYFEFIEPINVYQYKNGKIIFDAVKKEQEEQKNKLRAEATELKDFLKNTDSAIAQHEEETELIEAEIIEEYTMCENQRIEMLEERHKTWIRLKEIERLLWDKN